MVKESLTASRPLEVSAVPLAGLTALEALTQSAGVNLDGSGQQKNILITAASGGGSLCRSVSKTWKLTRDSHLRGSQH